MLKHLLLASYFAVMPDALTQKERPLEEIAATVTGKEMDFSPVEVMAIPEYLFVCNRGRPEQVSQWTFDYEPLHPSLQNVPLEELKEIILFSAEYRLLKDAGRLAMNVPQFADMHRFYFRAKRATTPEMRQANEWYLLHDSGDDFGFRDHKVNSAIFYTPQVLYLKEEIRLDDDLDSFEQVFYWTFGSIMQYIDNKKEPALRHEPSQEKIVLLHSAGIHLTRKIMEQYLFAHPDAQMQKERDSLYSRFAMNKEIVTRYLKGDKMDRAALFEDLGASAGNEAQIALYERYGGNAQIEDLIMRLENAYGTSMLDMIINNPSSERLEKMLISREQRAKKRH